MDAEHQRPARRADARRNRRLILHAARECFAETGTQTPIAGIARRAGLGKGTLYRHFSTRQDLVESVAAEYYLDAHGICDDALAQEDPWRGLAMCLLGLAQRAVLYENVLRKTTESADSEQRLQMSAALLTKLERITDRAIDANVARKGLTGRDVALLARMLASAQGLVGHPLTDDDRRRLAEITLSGLRPKSG